MDLKAAGIPANINTHVIIQQTSLNRGIQYEQTRSFRQNAEREASASLDAAAFLGTWDRDERGVGNW